MTDTITPTATSRPRCHCGKLGVFGYRDRAPWPRRLPSGAVTEPPTETKLVWFCVEHRFAQCYADAKAPP
jgi:hypothetical protein